jgi:hypothetical protein
MYPTLLDAFSGLIKYYSMKGKLQRVYTLKKTKHISIGDRKGFTEKATKIAEDGMNIFRRSIEIMKTCEC